MKVEPPKDIGMEAVTVLVHKGKVELLTGENLSENELKVQGNAFDKLCATLDPNVTYINALLPDHIDSPLYFSLRSRGINNGIHVQSVTLPPDEIWERWELHKEHS